MIAMNNSYAAITAPNETTNLVQQRTPYGAVYIYDTSDFSLKHSILCPDHVKDDYALYGGEDWNRFGSSLAIDDTHAFVGARGLRKVYVINLETGQIDSTISSTITNFGINVAVSSSYIAVSDSRNDSDGQVHVYNKSDLSFVYSISNPNVDTVSSEDYFGSLR